MIYLYDTDYILIYVSTFISLDDELQRVSKSYVISSCRFWKKLTETCIGFIWKTTELKKKSYC